MSRRPIYCPDCTAYADEQASGALCAACGAPLAGLFVGHGMEARWRGGRVSVYRATGGPVERAFAVCASPGAAMAAFRLIILGEDPRHGPCSCARCRTLPTRKVEGAS